MDNRKDPKELIDSLANSLVEGQKVTLIWYSDFGFLAHSQCVVIETLKTRWAQYENAIQVTFKTKGKRVLTRLCFYASYAHSKTPTVFSGWVNPDTSMYKDGSNISLPSFDRRYMEDAIASIPAKPLFITDNGITE